MDPVHVTCQKLDRLLSDWGYIVEGSRIIQLRIGRYASERIFGHCRDMFDAAEQLRPIIADSNFGLRLDKIRKE